MMEKPNDLFVFVLFFMLVWIGCIIWTGNVVNDKENQITGLKDTVVLDKEELSHCYLYIEAHDKEVPVIQNCLQKCWFPGYRYESFVRQDECPCVKV